MSDLSQGPQWWQAADLKWYPPELHADYVAPLPPPPKLPPPPNLPVPPRDEVGKASGQALPPPPRGDVAEAGGRERKLSQAERSQILDVALMSRAPGSVGIIGGRIRNTGPRIKRSATSAEVSRAMPVTHPGRFCWELILAFLTCGIYLPFWFIATLRRPRVEAVTIDEYGNQHWRQATISSAQRLISIVVGVLLLLWIYAVIQVFDAIQAADQSRCNTYANICTH